MALVSLITVIALLKASNLSPAHEEASHNLAQEMGMVERIHVMIVMCNKHDNRKAKGEVMVLCVSLDIRCQTIKLFAPNTSNIFENTKFALMMNS